MHQVLQVFETLTPRAAMAHNRAAGPGSPLETPGSVAVEQQQQPALSRPRRYQVVMLNDDYTPMDFVVHVLGTFFGMTTELATRVMLKVHTEGRAVCGVFTRDVAETRAAQVNHYAQQNQHPLLCQIEAADDAPGDPEP